MNTMNLKSTLLSDIDLRYLQQKNIQGIILDLDNTIVSEDDQYLSPNAESWIQAARDQGMQMFILSNGKSQHRAAYWSNRLCVPALAHARKPFPTAFKYALSQMRLQSKQVIVVGDSLHTDIIGAWIIGASSVQVASLPHPKRWWEFISGGLLHLPLPSRVKLVSLESTQTISR
jgi:uncharacterized protein